MDKGSPGERRPTRDFSVEETLLSRTSAYMPSADTKSIRYPAVFWVALAFTLAFAGWCAWLVQTVSHERSAVADRVGWLISAQSIQRSLHERRAAPTVGAPIDREALIKELWSVQRELETTPDAGPLVDLFAPVLAEAERSDTIDKAQLDAMIAALGDFVAGVRRQNAAISIRLGARWDMITVIVSAALLFAAIALILLARSFRRRRELELWKDALERSFRDVEIARREAKAANAAKSRFLANISHEIRTPMNGILGLVGVMLENPRAEEEERQLETVQTCGHHLLQLINDLLDMAKIDAGRLTLHARPVDLRGVVEDLARLWGPKAGEKNLELKTEIYELPEAVEVDQDRLHQILSNLISNAIKFTQRGAITITARGEPLDRGRSRVELSVRDTGIGIPLTVQQRLFQRFEQADSTWTRRHQGTGLGLSICRELVEAMAGTINVESAPGEGSTFRVTLDLKHVSRDQLPRTVRRPTHSAEELLLARERALAKIRREKTTNKPAERMTGAPRLLVVDDNPVNLQVAKAMLSRLGYAIETAANGQQALARIDQDQDQEQGPGFTVILMDCEMPVMDGYDATAQLRERERERSLPRTPVLAMTANVAIENRDRCMAVGMDDFVPKPVDPARLASLVGRWVKKGISGSPDVSSRPVFSRVSARSGPADDSGITRAGGAVEVDMAVIRQLDDSGGGEPSEFVRRLIKTFLDEAARDVGNIAKALDDADWKGTARAAHRLKGSAGNLGARTLSRCCAGLVRQARAGAVSDPRGTLLELRRVFGVTKQRLLEAVGTPEETDAA